MQNLKLWIGVSRKSIKPYILFKLVVIILVVLISYGFVISMRIVERKHKYITQVSISMIKTEAKGEGMEAI